MVREAAGPGAPYVQTPEMTNIVDRTARVARRLDPVGAH